MAKKVVTLMAILFLMFTFSFSAIVVVTSIPPLGYAVQQIGRNLVKVTVLTHAGDNPHTYTLVPRQAIAISHASLFVSLGLPQDKWIEEKVLSIRPTIDVVDSTCGLDQFLIGKDGNYNPHLWLDVKLYEMMCTNIYYILTKKYPKFEKNFAMNFANLLERLEALNRFIIKKMKPYAGRNFVAQHPAWNYFARAYGLGREYALENDAGQSITPRQYEEILKIMKEDHIDSIIGDPVTPSAMTKTLSSQSGARVVEINPIYNTNYFELMKNVVQGFVEAFK